LPTYFVSPPNRPEWAENPESFALALRERWPDAQVREAPEDSTMAEYFEVADVSGALDRGGQAINIAGSLEGATEVAAWWRARVPNTVDLLFYDEGYSADVPVGPGMDGEALASAYLGAVNT
jgi:hypothetical protein